MFFKKGVLKNSANFSGKHMCLSLFLIKLQAGRPATRLQRRCFPVKFAKFLRTPFLQNTSGGCFYLLVFQNLNNVTRRTFPDSIETKRRAAQNRSSHRRCSLKRVLKNFEKSTLFSGEFCEIFKNTYFQEHL